MSLAKRNYLSELEQIDWDFSGERATEGSGASHWYPARFVPQVPGILAGFLTERGDLILDPFCGSGTSLVEALRLGRSAIGIDTNPVAVMITRSRTILQNSDEFFELSAKLRIRVVERILSNSDTSHLPNFSENSRWYDPSTLHELGSIWLETAAPSHFNLVARAVFSGILRYVCSQDKHWGWICDNVRPKKLRYRPVFDVYFSRLESHISELRRLARVLEKRREAGLRRKIYRGDSKAVLLRMPEASVDAVITSPPYYGMTDYVRSQRLSYLWFGWPFDSDRALETGARYKRHRNAAHFEYMNEITAAFVQISRVLKLGRHCAIVGGESPDREPYLDQFKGVLEEHCSLVIESVLHRTVARQRALTSRAQTEEIIIARRV